MTFREPRILRLRQQRDATPYLRRYARASDCSALIRESTILYDEDEQRAVIVYLAPIAEDTRVLVDALRHVAVRTSYRTGGMPSHSRVFGFSPRNPRHDDFCTVASLATEDPAAHDLLCGEWAGVVARYYARYGPQVYARHLRSARRVLPEWTLEGTAFTSGIVNRDNLLPYHYDAGNFRGVWSAMLGFRRHATGGHLAVPAYDVRFEIADKSLLLFDGQAIVHGVTPFRIQERGHRLTVVYYSLEQLWHCLPFEQEVARAQRKAARP